MKMKNATICAANVEDTTEYTYAMQDQKHDSSKLEMREGMEKK